MKSASMWMKDARTGGYRWRREVCLAVAVFTVAVLYGLAALRYDATSWSRWDRVVASGGLSNDVLMALRPEEHTGRPSTTISMEWNITKGHARPDGVLKVFLVNGQFPGPTIEARSGDELVISVLNSLEDDAENVSIHWHGLKVENLMDGVAGVTQCALKRGETATYRLRIPHEQAGTFWYHTHSSVQRADGLFGALIVHDPNVSDAVQHDYTEDRVLQIGDWYHQPASEVLQYYDDWKNYKIEPIADSMVLNGHGRFDCSMAVPARPVDCQQVSLDPSLYLTAEKTRLRIINTGSLLGFNISLAGFQMRVIKTDAGNQATAQPPTHGLGIFFPGERVDVVLERLAESPGRFTVSLDDTVIRFPNLALTPVQHFPIVSSTGTLDAEDPSLSADESPDWLDLASLRGSAESDLSVQADKTVLLYTNIAYLSHFENRPRGLINHTGWQARGEGQLPLLALSDSEWPQDPAPFAVALQRSESVDLIINNMDDKPHSFHLHGHDFWVLQRHQARRVGAYEAFNPFESERAPGGPLNLVDPVKKDTVVVPSSAYVVLRFSARAVGVWVLHCHVLWHDSVGMAMAFRTLDRADPRAMSALQKAASDGCR